MEVWWEGGAEEKLWFLSLDRKTGDMGWAREINICVLEQMLVVA